MTARPAWLARIDRRGLAAFGLPLLLYVLTLAPTIYNLDSAELTTAAATGGIVRATGYPLYLILGRVWALLPLGDVGYRMNLLSAVSGALTVFLLDRVLRRWRVGPWATAGALGLLAVSTYFWGLSLIAEVYTLHTALMALLLLLLLRWSDDPTPARLATVALALGVSFTHHAATVLLVPGIAWYVLTVAPRRALAPRALGLAVGAFAVGLSLYLYLPFLHAMQPTFNYAGLYDATGAFQPVDLRSPGGLWWLISGKAFAGVMMAYEGADLWRETQAFGVHLWQAFFAVGVGPALVGLVVLARRNWRLAGMLGAMFALNAAFYIDYRVIDKETMFLPTYVVWTLWLAVGLEWLLGWLRESDDAAARALAERAFQVGIVASVALALALNWGRVDLSHDWSARVRGEAILHQVQPDALVFGWWETVPVLEYLQQVEGQRPDVQAINRFLIPYQEMETMILDQIGERPIYMDVPPNLLLHKVKAHREGVLYRLTPLPPPRASPRR